MSATKPLGFLIHVLRVRALIIQASSPIKIALARESLWRKSALINEINPTYFSPISPLVKSDGDVIQEASRKRHGSIGRCTNSQRLMKTACSGEENRKKLCASSMKKGFGGLTAECGRRAATC